MTEEEFDETWFQLVESSDYSPHTGIKINIDGTYNYQAQSTFRFTNKTLSHDADLTSIILSKNFVDEENSQNTTYKEYGLTPTFNKDTLNYTVELLDLIDTMDITAKLNDENASMKLKVPKRNEDNELMYESDGQTIQYEEKDIEDDEPFEITLNKLGGPETVIEIKVTAEDGVTTKNYQVTIKRPFGTIKGTIQLGNGLRESMEASYGTYVEYIATATLYKSDLFDWDGIVPKTASLNDLDLLEKQGEVVTDKDDGSYTIYVIPGEYDLILERLGFLASVVTKINIAADEVIDIGNKVLIEGDTDRTGIIDLDDIVTVVNMSDTMEGDGVYNEIYDFGQKGFVGLDDLVSVVNNSDSLISIEQYSN